jgi:hypothetical protein
LHKALSEDIHTRTIRSLHYVLDLFAVGSFEESDAAVIHKLQSLRLHHSGLRYHFQQNKQWKKAGVGVPVNQTELLFIIYYAFYYIIIERLTAFGIDVSAQQRMDFLHLWNLMAHYVGVEPGLIIHEEAKAEAIIAGIVAWVEKDSELHYSEHAAQLTQGLLQFYHELIGDDYDVHAVLRYFMDDLHCDKLGLPRSRNKITDDDLPNLASLLLQKWTAVANDTCPISAKKAKLFD